MKTKLMFLKKVASIFCLLMLFVVNSKLYSQIIYTDIPDATPNATYPLDLNNDTIVDFLIYYGGGAGTAGVMCSPYNNNAYAGALVASVHLPWALSASTSICDTLVTWYDSSKPGTMALGTSEGNWIGAADKYLALKLNVGSNTYYGWARLDISASSTSFTIKDYAYQSKPNACIIAGQNISGINKHADLNSFSIFPNPFSTSTTIHKIGHLKSVSLTIYNAYGKTVKELKNITGQNVSLTRDNLASGHISLGLQKKTITLW